jgi:hypothetical protein
MSRKSLPGTDPGLADFSKKIMRKDKTTESGIAELEAIRSNAWLSSRAPHAAPS